MRISLGLLLLGSIALNVSCGKGAKAGHENVDTMDSPQYPQIEGDAFTLNSPKSNLNYKGTILLFNDNTAAAPVAEVINASSANRQAWADIKKFEVDSDYLSLYGDGGQAAKQLQLMKDGLQAYEIDALSKNPISSEARSANALTWIDREIADLNLNDAQTAAFNASWGEYCEAKVIELAVHPLLAQNTFKSIPNPAPVCQQYYTDHAILTSADCTSDDGDYFKCLWLDGVAKTRWFALPAGSTDANRTDKLNRLAALLNDDNYAATKGVFAFTESSFNLTSAAIKKLYFDKKEAFLNIALDQKTDANCVKAIASVGSQDICKIFGLSPEPHTPRQIIAAVEGTTPNQTIYQPLPAHADRASTTEQTIRYLNQRVATENSESDHLFFVFANTTVLTTPSFSTAGASYKDLFPEIRAHLAPDFYGSFTDADNVQIASKTQTISYLDSQINESRDTWTALNQNVLDTTDRGIRAANAPGVGVAFLQYDMAYEQFGNILRAELSFTGYESQVFRACFDLVSNQGVACPDGLPLQEDLTIHEASLSKAADGGMIQFSMKLDHANDIGFAPKARVAEGEKPDFFNDLPLTETEGRTLRFELYRNRLDGVLDIMTGKAFIEQDGQRKYEAGISMWEQAN